MFFNFIVCYLRCSIPILTAGQSERRVHKMDWCANLGIHHPPYPTLGESQNTSKLTQFKIYVHCTIVHTYYIHIYNTQTWFHVVNKNRRKILTSIIISICTNDGKLDDIKWAIFVPPFSW